MGKKKKIEDQYFPIPHDITLGQSAELEDSPPLTRQIVQTNNSSSVLTGKCQVPRFLASRFWKEVEAPFTEEQVLHVTSLSQSNQPEKTG